MVATLATSTLNPTALHRDGAHRKSPAPAIGIDAALTDPNLLGAALGEPETWQAWQAWLALLRAAFGLPLDAKQRAIFDQCAGGRVPPTRPVREVWFVIGRRSGKSRMAAAIASYLASIPEYVLAPGEVGHVLCLAASMLQAKGVHNYAGAFLRESPILRQQIVDDPA